MHQSSCHFPVCSILALFYISKMSQHCRFYVEINQGSLYGFPYACFLKHSSWCWLEWQGLKISRFWFSGQQCKVGNLLCTTINRYGFPVKCVGNLFSHSGLFKRLPSSHWNLCVPPISNFTMFWLED